MRRTTAWFVVVGVAIIATDNPLQATEGFWVSLASGFSGTGEPQYYYEQWFETPHGPPPLAVTRTSGVNAQATTGGGTAFFNNGAVPVVIHPTDGYAYLTGGNRPSDLSQALQRQMAYGRGLASSTPDASATVPPSNANLLTLDATAPDDAGNRVLTVALTNPQGQPLVEGSIPIPSGGWWVIGLGPNPNGLIISDPEPLPLPELPPVFEEPEPTPGLPPQPSPTPELEIQPTSPSNPPPPPPTELPTEATPEPGTLMLASVGGAGAFGWRWFRRRRKARGHTTHPIPQRIQHP
ncbi:MAG: PEP-CTERM sorting domain-containing protein [Gemmataceae bacterium]|nr:PEP-CTERM sorting domain-containing protein [Gemmata sp.]MDW8197331.1 PEP-CTERM sorting domain-containing protein [Gemmataceae bacterium]